jgi:NitT/TauT family transport system substrate-binding protein
MGRQRAHGRVTALFLTAGLLAACGGGDEEPTGSADQQLSTDEPVSIRVGALPVGDMAPLYLAVQEGFFEDEGLDVEIQQIPGGAAGVPAMVSGELQFSSSNWVSVILAASEGLELEIVIENSGNATGVNAILTGADSPLQSVADLAGQSVAVNTLGGPTEIVVRECLRGNGLDPGDYSLVEIPFPDQGSAIAEGQIAAGLVAEPFVTLGTEQGQRVLVDTPTCTPRLEGWPLIGWAATAEYTAENPEVAAAFARAMDEAIAFAADNPDAVNEIVQTFTSLTPELAERVVQPGWLEETEPSLERAELTQDLMIDNGLLDEPVDDLESLIFTTD